MYHDTAESLYGDIPTASISPRKSAFKHLRNHKSAPRPLSTVVFVSLIPLLLCRRYSSSASNSQAATFFSSTTTVAQTMSPTRVVCGRYIVLYQPDYGDRQARFTGASLWRRVLVSAGAVKQPMRMRRLPHGEDSLICRRPLDGARSHASYLRVRSEKHTAK